MRTRRYHTTHELVALYKSHILSFIEYRTPAIYHAATSVLESVDRIQAHLLRQLGISHLEALLDFNLAPLESRRDIAMLGVLHRASLQEGPQCFHSWFRLSESHRRHSTRQRRNSARPLAEILPVRSKAIARRSAFGLVSIYNFLPNEVVTQVTVKEFQQALSNLMKQQARAGHPQWSRLFSPRSDYISHPLRHLAG